MTKAAAVRVLVDTSVWVDFVRDRPVPHVKTLGQLLGSKTVICMAPPILQEVLQGALKREHQATLERRFRFTPQLAFADPVAGATAAAGLYLTCRLAGTTPRSSVDCLIACIAIEHDLALLHNDRDFDAIARVEPRLRIYPCKS